MRLQKRVARGGRGFNRARGRGCGRNERTEDEVSQHGENPGGPHEHGEDDAQDPVAQNPQNQLMNDFVAVLAASNLLTQAPRANTPTRAIEAVKEFRRLNPPKFDGASSDLKEANHWLYESHQQGN